MSAPNKAKPEALRPILEAAAEAARCRVAEELFDLVKVKEALLRAADQGLRVCVFRPVAALNLRGTPAADALEKWAAKEGLTVEWGTAETVTEGGFDRGQLMPVAVRFDAPRLVPA